MAEWQVQKSRDGHSWVPMRPAGNLPSDSMTHGEHWFPKHHDAWVAGQHLRNALLWSQIRIVRRDADGQIADEGPVL